MRFYVVVRKYGNGCYFATTARDALYYSQFHNPDSAVTQIICAEVVTGVYRLGNRGLKTLGPDEHSVTDNLEYPSMFIVFKDAAARPSHVITIQYEP